MDMDSKSRALDKIYKRRDRYEIPEWQRQKVWPTSKKQNLIDSVLRGWKLPKFYFLKTSNEPEEFEVVDGQQRLAAIWDFFDNELTLSRASAKKFGAEYHKDLPDALQDFFDDYEIQYDEIQNATDEDVKEFFQRLQEGLPLTSSEKLNSIHSKLRDFAARLAEHSFFKNKVSASDKRYGHFDIAAKAASLEIDGLEAGTRFDDLQAVFKSQANFSADSAVGKRLLATLDFLDNAFDQRNRNLRNRTIVQSLITLCTKLLATGKLGGHEKKIVTFFDDFMEELSRQVQLGHDATDQDYMAFQRTFSANVRTGAKTRQEILLRKLLANEPSLATIFDSTMIAESGFSAAIRQDADTITVLVNAINEKYSAEHGRDLFKPTNKTVLSQMSLGEVIEDFDGYKTLLDNLYFLFHEGVGNRLENKMPCCFKDVNDLRTAIHHDVDHGKAGKAKKKKKQLGLVFKKYCGELSPETLSPERFKILQANLLSALRRDLENLAR